MRCSPRTAVDDAAAKERAIKAGANWVMGMQSRDGGFAAFDADNDSKWLNQLPFADVEAVTDPTCPDLTGRVLEMMAAVGYRADHPVARRAIAWLQDAIRRATAHGGDAGASTISTAPSRRWSGLRAIGVDMNEPWIQARGRMAQDRCRTPTADGARAALSDKDPSWRGRGTSTASQTAWALIGLLAGEDEISDNVTRGVTGCSSGRTRTGAWDETEFTGTGFPNHFYLRYHCMRITSR